MQRLFHEFIPIQMKSREADLDFGGENSSGFVFKCNDAGSLLMAFWLMVVLLLAGCSGSQVPNLSGTWENDVVGSLTLTQSGNVLTAEQKDPDFQAFFGPKMFEGTIEDGVLKGKVATALPSNLRATCGSNWGSWSDLELRVAPDGLSLEGKWLRGTNNTAVSGCPILSTEWQPFRLSRGAGQLPVELNTVPKWLAGIVLALGLLTASGFRWALVRYLVGPLKRSPNVASTAGWALFVAFVSGSAAVSATMMGPQLAVPVIWGPLAGISILGLIAAMVMGAKR